jgi:benzoate-CoA ligase family protein
MAAPPVFPEDLNLADYFLFDRLVEGLGDEDALLFGERRYTYAEVAERVRALAGFLTAAGVAREERVLLALPDTPAFVWAFFAVLHHGAVVVMGNPDAPPADLASLVELSRAPAVITLPRVAAAILPALLEARLRALVLSPDVATGGDVEADPDPADELAALAPVSLRDALSRGRSHPGRPRRTHRDDVAIWLLSSGSTGRRKAAMHLHRDFAFNTEAYAKRTIGYRREDVTLSVPRLFFGYATGTNLMFPFAVGATVALYAERPTPASLAAAVARHRPTIVTNVPTMMSKLLDHDDALAARGAPRLDLGGARFHLSGGEALPPALLQRFTERFGTPVYDGIGSAETFHTYATNRPGDVRPGSLGRAVEGYTLRILPAEAPGPGAPELPRGETGVLWVRGDSVALGYFQDKDKSWATFFGPWCRTGDLFAIDAEGYVHFRGRADDLLKVSGLWCAPVEVEECLMRHPAVSLAAVIGAQDEGLTKPKAFVVLRDSARGLPPAALAEELKAFVRERLHKHKYPRWVVFVGDLPRNDRGKADRKALAEREARGEGPRGL